ncbi:hypothetical protein M4D81_33285 [Paenibacillus sp. p3-SID867]|uniref:hypothetical protein n=1 Tax=Paenibacillus sp. p3-SID867 TaxID=2916363 RepID=UPI0021A4D310|nr:hypothetical protein [Paenibacillus sp. p3-SID867]MCT1403883.1 hypothetical protein [Paenibacillus sp. p3-SID867]
MIIQTNQTFEEQLSLTQQAPKERDRVVHKKYKQYGTGVIIEIARSGVRALCVFPDANPPVIAYYKIDNLVVALKNNN